MIWTIGLRMMVEMFSWRILEYGGRVSMVGVFGINRTDWEQVFLHRPSFCDHIITAPSGNESELSEAMI